MSSVVYETTLNVWQSNAGLIAVVPPTLKKRGQLTTPQIESVQQLSLDTPRITFAANRYEDEARVKISGGNVLVRKLGLRQAWHESTP